MPSAQSTLDQRKGDAIPLLKGSDLPLKTARVKIRLREVREAPADFGSPMIADLAEPVFDRAAFPLNKTNIKHLIELLGDDYAKWVGKTLLLEKIRVNNPKTGRLGWGLAVIDVVKVKK